MLDTLAGRVGVVADGGADAGDFVGGNAGPDAATANDYAAPSLAGGDPLGDGSSEVREVVQGIEGVCAYIVDRVAEGLQEGQELLFQIKAAVVSPEGEFFGCGRLWVHILSKKLVSCELGYALFCNSHTITIGMPFSATSIRLSI